MNISTKKVHSQQIISWYRSSHWRCSVKKGVLKNFAKFKGKHLCWCLFLMKAWRPATLLKIESTTGVYLWNLQNFQKHLFWRVSLNDCLCLWGLTKLLEKTILQYSPTLAGWFLVIGTLRSKWLNALSLLQVNPLSTNPRKWSNTLKQFVGNLLTNCFSLFDHFVGLALKRLTIRLSVILLFYLPVFVFMSSLQAKCYLPGCSSFELILDITTNVWKVSIFGVFLVCILPHSNWIRVISPNTGKYGPQKLRLRTRSTQCTQKWCFPFRIFLVDVHKSAESCGFIHNY